MHVVLVREYNYPQGAREKRQGCHITVKMIIIYKAPVKS